MIRPIIDCREMLTPSERRHLQHHFFSDVLNRPREVHLALCQLALGLTRRSTNQPLAHLFEGLPPEARAGCRLADSPLTFAEQTLALLALSGHERRAVAARGAARQVIESKGTSLAETTA